MDADAYELLERFAIMTVDGGQTDATALEYIRKTYPQTLINGVYREFLGKIDKLPAETGKPRQNEDTGLTKQKEKADRADFDTLRQYIEAGFALYAKKIGRKAEGDILKYFIDWRATVSRYTKHADKEQAKITTEQDLKQAMDNGVKYFAFVPTEQKYLCFDIDKGHDNGIDGLKVFAEYFKEKGIAYDFFSSKAVYTETPRGGRHLYFKDWTDTEEYLPEPFDNVEIRGGKSRRELTAAGSVKNGILYRLHGKLADAPRLPIMLIKHITPAPMIPRARTKTPRKSGNYRLAKLVDFVLQDRAGNGRNETAYYIGFRVGRQYDLESVIDECMTRPLFADFAESELRTAVKSGMKNSKY